MARIPGQPCRCRTGLSLTHEAIPNSSSEVLQAQRELDCGPDSYSKEHQIFVVALYRAGLPLTGQTFRVHLPSVTMVSGGLGPSGGPPPHRCTALEMLAVLPSLQHFVHLLVGHTVLVLTDNTTVAAYINRQRGTRSQALNDLATQLWNWFLWPLISRGRTTS